MQIVNDLGPVDHAWLEGGSIDPSCAGLRCRLVVGDMGGIVCDRIAGASRIEFDRMSSVATYAVLFTEPRDPSPLPLFDDAGRPARIVADPGDGTDMIVFDSNIAKMADEALFAKDHFVGPKSTNRGEAKRLLLVAGMVLCGVAFIMAMVANAWPELVRPELRTYPRVFDWSILAICGFSGLFGGILYRALKKKPKKSLMQNFGDSFAKMMDRELERRARLPERLEPSS
jgi:hypothetical protein